MSSASRKADPPVNGQRWDGRSKGTPLGYRIFILLIGTFGLSAAYGLLRYVSLFYLLTPRSSNAAMRQYWQKILGADKIPWSAPLRNYRALGEALIDRNALSMGKAQFKHLTSGREHIEALATAGKGGLLVSAHIGNWELAGDLLSNTGAQLSIVRFDSEREEVKQVLSKGSNKVKLEQILVGKDMAHIFQINAALQNGRLVCMHGDRFLPEAKTIELLFMGAPARFPLGPFAMACSFGVPICFTFVVKTEATTYTFTCSKPIHDTLEPRQLAKAFVSRLEEIVREHPAQWFNFYHFWGHE